MDELGRVINSLELYATFCICVFFQGKDSQFALTSQKVSFNTQNVKNQLYREIKKHQFLIKRQNYSFYTSTRLDNNCNLMEIACYYNREFECKRNASQNIRYLASFYCNKELRGLKIKKY